MKYFQLSYNSLNEEVTGTQFQSIEGDFGDIQNEKLPFENKISIDFKLPKPILEVNAKQTSLLNVIFIPSWFLVVSEDFLSFLKGSKTGGIQSWQLQIFQKKNIISNYQLFYLPKTKQSELIIFNQSDFYSDDFFTPNTDVKEIKIDSYQEYLSISHELEIQAKILKYSKLVLNLNNIELDIFRLVNSPLTGYFVSEKLKKEIEYQGFTGMEFNEIKDIDKRIILI